MFNPSLHTHFDRSTADSLENIVGKEESARNEHFLPSPQCFLLDQKTVSPSINIFDVISLFAAELQEPKIGMPCKGIKNQPKHARSIIY